MVVVVVEVVIVAVQVIAWVNHIKAVVLTSKACRNNNSTDRETKDKLW